MVDRPRYIQKIAKAVDRLVGPIKPVSYMDLPHLEREMNEHDPRLMNFLLGGDPRHSYVIPAPLEINLGPLGKHLRLVEDQRGSIIKDGLELETEGEVTLTRKVKSGEYGISFSNDGMTHGVRHKRPENILRGRRPYLSSHTHRDIGLPTPYADYLDILTEDFKGRGRMAYATEIACPGFQVLVVPSHDTPIMSANDSIKAYDAYVKELDEKEKRMHERTVVRYRRFVDAATRMEGIDADKFRNQLERVKRKIAHRGYMQFVLPYHNEQIKFIAEMRMLLYGATDHTHFRRLTQDDLVEISKKQIPQRVLASSY